MNKIFIPGRTAVVTEDRLNTLAMLNIAEALWHLAYMEARHFNGEGREQAEGLAEVRRNALTQVLIQAFAAKGNTNGVNQ